VTTQAAAGTKTAGDSPDGARLSPQLRKAAASLSANGRKRSGQKVLFREDRKRIDVSEQVNERLDTF